MRACPSKRRATESGARLAKFVAHSPFMASPDILETLARRAFAYFEAHTNPENGLVADSSRAHAPASIAAVGMALTCYSIAVERGWWRRGHAVEVTLKTLRFFAASTQSERPDATGNRGFYYHFLDMRDGQRAWKCELSSIDSALLFAGMLAARAYFDRDTPDEREVRERADELFARANWNWMCNDQGAVALGWRPKRGFLPYAWRGYNEGLLLQILALGAPQHVLSAPYYKQWCSTYKWKKIYGHEFLYAGPLFIHQFPQLWLDLRGVQDDFMREKNCDYFENSGRATQIQREYARRNPRAWKGYDENHWGISASDGPGPQSQQWKGKLRQFYGYAARGVPFGPDDGTLASWAAIASLPFAPEVVMPFIERHVSREFEATCNASFADGWHCQTQLAINNAPMIVMLENYRSGLTWGLMRACPIVQHGLKRAGFAGGWLDEKNENEGFSAALKR